ncbi:hypothetical protein OHB01_12915 [Microbispora hainanensis]|uniref:hypothetical protein n=1 Tax=Microbispora hainanensis TaxID=568844 RepID=UPI002E2D0083|nr:hypothetical protein [Microbispora hainanensis]
MGWAIFFFVYLVISIAMAKRYYLRRHGVPGSTGGPGTGTAGYIGLAWPITIFLARVRNPSPCYHMVHIAARNRAREILAMRRQEG